VYELYTVTVERLHGRLVRYASIRLDSIHGWSRVDKRAAEGMEVWGTTARALTRGAEVVVAVAHAVDGSINGLPGGLELAEQEDLGRSCGAPC
jgi:hypothetical protein